MQVMMMLMLLATTTTAPGSAIEATIEGTKQPLDAYLFIQNGDAWTRVAHQQLPATTRRVRFAGLESGIYQLLLRGPGATEQLSTKIAVGADDVRRRTIAVAPFTLTGSITHGGTHLAGGAIVFRHRELEWRGGVGVGPDGTFRATLWQRGDFMISVRNPALATDYSDAITIDSAKKLAIDIPDGRITGIIRDAKSSAPVANAIVALQSNVADREEHVKLTTGPGGKFDFAGVKHGSHIVRIYPPQHLEPAPIAFDIDAKTRLRELDVRVDPGRTVPIVVIDKENDPVAEAKVFAVSEGKLRARTTTDEDGRASIAIPAGESATLFVVTAEGPFAMQRVPREDDKRRLQIYLPRSTSSLLIRARTTDGQRMPPFTLLMRFNGELVPAEVAEELTAVQGLELATNPESEAHLRNIPSGSYEFWPYRTDEEAEAIVAAGAAFLAPIQVNVRTGENRIAVKFTRR